MLLCCRRKGKLERNLKVKEVEHLRLSKLADPLSKEPVLRATISKLATQAVLAVCAPLLCMLPGSIRTLSDILIAPVSWACLTC